MFHPFGYAFYIIQQLRPGDKQLARSYGLISLYLSQFPQMQPGRLKEIINCQYLTSHARRFLDGRISRGPRTPATATDQSLKDILQFAYDIPAGKLEEALNAHRLVMGAENFLGWILEHYIAAQAEPLGWAWCSGGSVKSIDFLRITRGGWQTLQVKNRSNSENSSSARVRDGTEIELWFRLNAKTGATN